MIRFIIHLDEFFLLFPNRLDRIVSLPPRRLEFFICFLSSFDAIAMDADADATSVDICSSAAPPPPPSSWDVAGVQSTDAVASSDVGPSYSRSTPTGWWRRRPADRSSCCKNHQKCWRRRPTPRSTSPEMGRRRPPPPQSQWNTVSTFDPDSHRPRFRDAFLNAATSPASFPRDEHPKLKRRPMKSTTSATTTTTPQWTLSINHRPAQRNPIETNDQRRWRRPEVVEKWPRVLLV